MDSCDPIRQLIAESPLCRVEQCACGTLFVTVGALTLRVHADALAVIHRTLGDALAIVARERAREREQDLALS